MSNKLLIITGPTATGKTELAIKLAKKLNGELINADSRQVYQGMDIGTGKDLSKNSKFEIPACAGRRNLKLNPKLSVGYRKKEGIPIWLVDVCKPNYVFNVGEYQKLAKLVIQDIQNRGRLPIVVGGTGLYIKSIIEPMNSMQIPPNEKLRQQLNNLTIEQLQIKLVKLDKLKFNSMNNSDVNNPRRLVRAIEIEEYYLSSRSDQLVERDLVPTKVVDVKCDVSLDFSTSSDWFRNDKDSPLPIGDYLLIGLNINQKLLEKKINERVEKRFHMGILEEIQKLLNSGFNWDLPSMSGLGYREWKEYFDVSGVTSHVSANEDLKNKILNLWKLHEKQYVKKQLTFLKKMPNINWFDVSKPDYYSSVETQVELWYNGKND